jgi:cholesterol oxidase
MGYAINGRLKDSSHKSLQGILIKAYEMDPFHDDLYVMDGSVIPSPIGVNPSLTISALAFRTAAYIENKE